MNSVAHCQGRRVCFACHAETAIEPGAPLWPTSWRCISCGFQPPRSDGFVLLAPDLNEENAGFDLRNFEILPHLEDAHFWFISRNELIRWLVQRFAPCAKSVLEIGCGTGFAIRALRDALPEAHVVASELHSAGLATARQRYGDSVELVQMDARQSGLLEALDLIGAFDVLEHIPEDDIVLDEIFRMLRPGGIFIATVPQHPWMWSTTDDLALHQRRYRLGELSRKANVAGLETVYTSSFTTLAFPLMVASRFAARLKSTPRTFEQQIEAEYRMSPAACRMMLGFARIEHALRKLNVPMPFGGSQVLVAKKSDQSQ